MEDYIDEDEAAGLEKRRFSKPAKRISIDPANLNYTDEDKVNRWDKARLSISAKRRSVDPGFLRNFRESPGGVSFDIDIEEFISIRKKSGFQEVKTSVSDDESEEIRPFHYFGIYGLDEHSFNDEDRPVVKFEDYEDLELTEDETDGYLTDRVIAACSSYLERNPITKRYALCKCDLKKKVTKNIYRICKVWSF